MKIESLQMLERMKELATICARDNPLYEQVDCFSIALYAIGCLDAEDLMSADDLDDFEAADFLKQRFEEITKVDISPAYKMTEDSERYLMVLGDPEFPKHFAVVADMESDKPFFSKLRYFGSGYDSLEELIKEYLDEGVTGYEDVHYFKLNGYRSLNNRSRGEK